VILLNETINSIRNDPNYQASMYDPATHDYFVNPQGLTCRHTLNKETLDRNPGCISCRNYATYEYTVYDKSIVTGDTYNLGKILPELRKLHDLTATSENLKDIRKRFEALNQQLQSLTTGSCPTKNIVLGNLAFILNTNLTTFKEQLKNISTAKEEIKSVLASANAPTPMDALTSFIKAFKAQADANFWLEDPINMEEYKDPQALICGHTSDQMALIKYEKCNVDGCNRTDLTRDMAATTFLKELFPKLYRLNDLTLTPANLDSTYQELCQIKANLDDYLATLRAEKKDNKNFLIREFAAFFNTLPIISLSAADAKGKGKERAADTVPYRNAGASGSGSSSSASTPQAAASSAPTVNYFGASPNATPANSTSSASAASVRPVATPSISPLQSMGSISAAIPSAPATSAPTVNYFGRRPNATPANPNSSASAAPARPVAAPSISPLQSMGSISAAIPSAPASFAPSSSSAAPQPTPTPPAATPANFNSSASGAPARPVANPSIISLQSMGSISAAIPSASASSAPSPSSAAPQPTPTPPAAIRSATNPHPIHYFGRRSNATPANSNS
jgi:hypothetical protein